MTQLAQAKKEAKRLFTLAKSNPHSGLIIPSLSEAQKIVAFMNGYNNWHDFEQNLKKKESLKEFGSPKNILSSPIEFLPMQVEQNLVKYHIQANMDNILMYKNEPLKFPLALKNSGLGFSAGTTEIKGTLSTKEYKVYFRPSNTTYWGMNGSGLHTTIESIAYQGIKKNCGLVYVSYNGDIYQYFKFYIMSQETNRIDELYCLNFNAQDASQTHSIDPINPVIPFKDNFLLMLGMQNNAFSDIFYDLCGYCYHHKIAIDANTLLNLLSFNNLANYEHHVLKNVFASQAARINEYLASIGFTPDDENNMHIIQQHHINVQHAINYSQIIQKYEQKGVFSCYAKIDLSMICLQSKILSVICGKENNHELNHLFMTQLFTIQKAAFQQMEANINSDYANLVGFATMNFFSSIGGIFNPLTLSLFEKNLKEQSGRRIINLIADQDYTSALSATSFNHTPNINLLNEVLYHFEQHMIMQQEDHANLPPIIIEKIVKECENFDNVFYKGNYTLKNLQIGHGYFFYKSEHDVNEKLNMKKLGIKKGFFKKIKAYYEYPRLLHKQNTLMPREILRT